MRPKRATKNMKYEMNRVPVNMGGPAIVVRDESGRCVFESKDYTAAKTERDRLNAGGSEIERLHGYDERRERQPDGTVLRIPLMREVRLFA